MPQFLTRQSNLQQQPQAAQLPFSQFGGQRGPLPGDTTGGIAFPDAGQPGQPQPGTSTANPFLLPTGLSSSEMDALLGRVPSSKQDIIGIDQPFTQFGRFTPQIQQNIAQQQARKASFLAQNPIGSNLTTGGIPFEGSGGFDKFNPIGAGGLNPNKLGGGF